MKVALVHIYCGDGKGKTTASCGLAVRALGAGMKVAFCQFFKDGSSAEVKSLTSFENLSYFKTDSRLPMFFRMTDAQKEIASKEFTELFEKVINQDCDLIVFDEIISAYNYNFFDKEMLIKMIKEKSAVTEIVMTGRNPSEELVDIADYVSEVKKIKHPFDNAIPARNGIEF